MSVLNSINALVEHSPTCKRNQQIREATRKRKQHVTGANNVKETNRSEKQHMSDTIILCHQCKSWVF